MTILEDLQKSSWSVSEEHGFHDAQINLDPKVLATYLKLFLTIGELCEAGEETRAGHGFTEIYYEFDIYGTKKPEHMIISDSPYMVLQGAQPLWFTELTPALIAAQEIFGLDADEVMAQKKIAFGKPAGFPIELADALIRLCDLAEDVGVSLSEACRIKEAYNRTREFMHGKTA